MAFKWDLNLAEYFPWDLNLAVSIFSASKVCGGDGQP
jgi:hypothetical protein